jgi:hypothetical protein
MRPGEPRRLCSRIKGLLPMLVRVKEGSMSVSYQIGSNKLDPRLVLWTMSWSTSTPMCPGESRRSGCFVAE